MLNKKIMNPIVIEMLIRGLLSRKRSLYVK